MGENKIPIRSFISTFWLAFCGSGLDLKLVQYGSGECCEKQRVKDAERLAFASAAGNKVAAYGCPNTRHSVRKRGALGGLWLRDWLSRLACLSLLGLGKGCLQIPAVKAGHQLLQTGRYAEVIAQCG